MHTYIHTYIYIPAEAAPDAAAAEAFSTSEAVTWVSGGSFGEGSEVGQRGSRVFDFGVRQQPD